MPGVIVEETKLGNTKQSKKINMSNTKQHRANKTQSKTKHRKTTIKTKVGDTLTQRFLNVLTSFSDINWNVVGYGIIIIIFGAIFEPCWNIYAYLLMIFDVYICLCQFYIFIYSKKQKKDTQQT